MAPLGPNGQMIGIVPPPHLVMERPHSAVPSKIYEKLGESKKRQRPKTAEPSKNGGPDGLSTPPTRFVKAQTKQSNSKHKFFRSRKEKERDNLLPPPMGSLSASTHQLHKEIKPTSQPSFFNMRYKSLTNLAHQVKTMTMAIVRKKPDAHRSSPHSSPLYFTLLSTLLFLIHPPHLFTTPPPFYLLSLCIIHSCLTLHMVYMFFQSAHMLVRSLFQEYDTLDSSNSGGKTSFDSAGSRHVPEKRSRKLSRPKSLTNLVWDLRGI